MKHQGLGLQGRFLTGLACILFFCSIVSAISIYLWGKQTIEEEALKRTQLTLAMVDAVQGYVREELRPTMYRVMGRDRFVLEAMSASYITRSVMDRLRLHLPEVRYRRVSLHPLNPRSAANEEERAMMRYFADNDGTQEWEGIRMVEGQPYYLRCEPITYDRSCVGCHRNGPALPAAIRQHYQQARYLPDNLALSGLVSIGIPIDTSLARIKDRAFAVFVYAFIFLVVLYSVIAFFFDRVVVQSLRQLLSQFRDNLCDEEGQQLYQIAASRDAIDEINKAAQGMADYIQQTRHQLADHASSLEDLVEERTAALRLSRAQLQEKVGVRNRELATLTSIAELIGRSPDLAAILPEILRLTLAVVPAGGAAIYLAVANRDSWTMELQCTEGVLELPRRIERPGCGSQEPETLVEVVSEAAAGRMGFLASEKEKIDSLSIPLTCRGRVHGAMLFVAVDFMVLNQETTVLLEAVGRQVGILVENMATMRKMMDSAALLQTVFDGITDPVVLLDESYRIRVVNRSFRRRHGQVDLVGTDCRKLPGCPFATVGEWTFRPGTAQTSLVRLADNIIFEVHFYPLFEEGDRLANIVCYGKDVTEQKLAEERSQHTEKMAAIGQLAAGIAHEINNPLGVILCHTDLVAGDPATPQTVRQDVRIIEKHATTCRNIVGALLQFARPVHGCRQIDDLNEIVVETVAMVRRQLENEGVFLEMALDERLPPVSLDRNRMKQVILNLVINAAQAMDGGGVITIASSRSGGHAVLTVADNGPGIAPEHLDRIFDPFFSTKEVGKGTGLGLSVSYGIVRDHQGEIKAANRHEGGALLTVTLPLAPTREDHGTDTSH